MPHPSAAEILDKVRKRLAELQAEVEVLQNLITAYAEIARSQPSGTDSDEAQLSLYGGSIRQARQERVAKAIAAARHLILTEGRPLKRGEIVKKLLAEGYEIEGADKNKVFGTNLWRSGQFITVEGEGYWPKDVPYRGAKSLI